MALSLSSKYLSKYLFSSLLLRYGQAQACRLCSKVPPDGSSNGSSDVNKKAESLNDKQETNSNVDKNIEHGGASSSQEITSEMKVESNVPKETTVSSEEITTETKVKSDVPKETTLSSEEITTETKVKSDVPKETTLSPEEISRKEQKAAAQSKLNNLLMSLSNIKAAPVKPAKELSLAKPKRKATKKREKKTQSKRDDASIEVTKIDPELIGATKEVAESLGGDVKATESELLSTIQSHTAERNLDTSAATSDSVPPESVSKKHEEMSSQQAPELTPESELLSSLRSHDDESTPDSKSTPDISTLLMGIKVDRTPSKPVTEPQQRVQRGRGPAAQPRRSMKDETNLDHPEVRKSLAFNPSRPRERVTVDLFGEKRLKIFDVQKDEEFQPSVPESLLPVWEAVHKREIMLSVTHPPANGFEEMIQWTKQGKLWTFPIDNFIGLEEEKKIGFHEHIFLEHHLDDWCPKRGPIRHFMELVCTGLSKNPHLTVERKKRHIQWYRDYFEAKQDTLQAIGALDIKQ